MPCSCFGKKDKKGGVLAGGEEDRYRPRDSREREPLVPILPPISVAPITPTEVQQSQTQPLLGEAPPPPATGTPPSTPVATPTTPGGDARLRPEDDPDKATRRRDVVASFYSDQCELIGFKATGSRPPSSHVGSIQDGPAATSSPAASSPSSTRSGGALCRSDLAEKRREFFRDLTLEDEERGSRPTSRLTDPGSQQTPRHSHYQDQLHHTLPHQNKTSPRSNKLANNPFIIQQALNKSANTSPTVTQLDYSEDTEPLLIHSSPQQAPKILFNNSDNSVSKVPKHLSSEILSHEPYFNDEFSEDTLLLFEKQTPSETQLFIDSSVSTTVQPVSPEMSFRSTDLSSLESKLVFDTSELNSPELLVDMTPTENSDLIINTTPVKHPELNVVFPTEPTESSQLLVDTPSVEFSELIVKSPTENSKLIEDFLSKNNSQVSFDVSASHSPQFIVDVPNTESEQLLVNKSVQESPQNVDHIALDSQLVLDNTPLISSTPKVEPFIQQDIQTPTLESYSVESPQSVDKHFDIEFSHEPLPQTLPVIINETLKEPHKDQSDHTFVITPHNTHLFSVDSPEEQSPQTFVETTRQFISSSPDEQKTSQTIVETTRQFITGPPEEEPTKTIVETTQQYISEIPEGQKTTTVVETTRHFISGSPDDDEETQNLMETAQQFFSGCPGEQTTQQYISEIPEEQKTTTVVETTRHFISGIPHDDEETQNLMETVQQFFSGSPDEQTTQTIVKTKQHFVTGSPDEQLTQTVVQTTKQFVSGSPDEQITTQTTIESTQQQSLPPSVDPFFLTSAEEPDELPEKLLLQSAAPTVTQTGDKPVPMPRIQFTEVETLKEETEEPKLPDVPCFGAPPPPASPPLPEEKEESTDIAVTFPVAVAMSPGKEEEPLPPAPPTPPAEYDVHEPRPSAPLLDQQQILQFETEPVPHTPPTPPTTTHGDNDDLPPAPPTPPTPRLDNVQLPSTPPMENELLPPTPPTPHREDELPPAPLTPPTMHKPLPPAPPIPPKSSSPHLPPVTCGVQIVSSSTLEDDGIGSEIDDALESLEGLSEEGKKIERAAASS